MRKTRHPHLRCAYATRARAHSRARTHNPVCDKLKEMVSAATTLATTTQIQVAELDDLRQVLRSWLIRFDEYWTAQSPILKAACRMLHLEYRLSMRLIVFLTVPPSLSRSLGPAPSRSRRRRATVTAILPPSSPPLATAPSRPERQGTGRWPLRATSHLLRR